MMEFFKRFRSRKEILEVARKELETSSEETQRYVQGMIIKYEILLSQPGGYRVYGNEIYRDYRREGYTPEDAAEIMQNLYHDVIDMQREEFRKDGSDASERAEMMDEIREKMEGTIEAARKAHDDETARVVYELIKELNA